MSNYELETVREIWDNKTGGRFEVGPDRDGLDLVEIRGKDSRDIIEQRIVMQPEEAKLVAEALLNCSTELINKGDNDE